MLSPDGHPAAAWTARDSGESGVMGDPLPATPEQGQAILDSLAGSCAQRITDLHHMHWIEREARCWAMPHPTGDIVGG